MDVIEASAIVTMAFAVGIGIQHMWDRYASNGLYRRTERRAAGIGTEIAAGVKSALIEAGREAEASMQEAAKSAETSMQMSMVRSVGVDKQSQLATSNMLAQAVVEQYLPMLRMVLPGVADQLEENPQLIFSVVENPYFKKYVLPRIQGFLPNGDGTPTPGSGASPGGSGWR